MRKAAHNANVSWDYEIIQYRKNGVAYQDGDSKDATVIIDELEKLLGYRPVVIDKPIINNTDQTQ
jgi:hypothetical protein